MVESTGIYGLSSVSLIWSSFQGIDGLIFGSSYLEYKTRWTRAELRRAGDVNPLIVGVTKTQGAKSNHLHAAPSALHALRERC